MRDVWKKRILSLALTAAMVLGAGAPALAAETPEAATVAPMAMPTGMLCSATAAASTRPAVWRSWWPQAHWWGWSWSSWWTLRSIQQLRR